MWPALAAWTARSASGDEPASAIGARENRDCRLVDADRAGEVSRRRPPHVRLRGQLSSVATTACNEDYIGLAAELRKSTKPQLLSAAVSGPT